MEQIKQALVKAGFDVLVDKDKFSLSHSTLPEMNRLVDAANLLVVLLSPDSIASKPVQHELKRGLKREQIEHRKIVFAAKVRSFSRRIPGWPEDRLWISLYPDFKKPFKRLVRNLRRAALSVVPLAQTSPTTEELAKEAERLLEEDGIRVRGNMIFYSRFGSAVADDPSRRIIALPTSNVDFAGPAFFCMYQGWTLFWHFPKTVLSFRAVSYLAEELLLAKTLLDIKMVATGPGKDLWLRDLARLAKRNASLMDVVLSPHAISQAHYARHNLAFLKWPKQKPFLVYDKTRVDSPWHSLPTFFAPNTRTMGDLHTVLRLLKSVIRVEVPRLHIPSYQWPSLSLGSKFSQRKKR